MNDFGVSVENEAFELRNSFAFWMSVCEVRVTFDRGVCATYGLWNSYDTEFFRVKVTCLYFSVPLSLNVPEKYII
jgi:hypothetical protein